MVGCSSPPGLPRKTQLGSEPVESQVLICHHRGAASVKLSISSQVPPGRGAATTVIWKPRAVPASVCARIWQKNVPVTGAVNRKDACIESWPMEGE